MLVFHKLKRINIHNSTPLPFLCIFPPLRQYEQWWNDCNLYHGWWYTRLSPLCHNKRKILRVGIQTISLLLHFTMVDTYDSCEISFSKYKKKASKKELLPWLTKYHCNIGVMKGLFCSSVFENPNFPQKNINLTYFML